VSTAGDSQRRRPILLRSDRRVAAGAFKLFFSSAFPSQFHSLPSMQMRLRVFCDLALPGVGDRRRGHARLSLRLRAAGRLLNRLNG
jgi:hypothetical protein